MEPQNSKSGRWFWYTDWKLDREFMKGEHIKGHVRGLELSEQGKWHWQGCIYAWKKTTAEALCKKIGFKNKVEGFFNKCGGDEGKHMWAYCKKCEKFEIFGEEIVPLDGSGDRTDLKSAVKIIKEEGVRACARKCPEVFVKHSRGLRELKLWIMEERENFKDFIWIYGETGSGKTLWCKENCKKKDGWFWMDNKSGKWWDGYDGEKGIVIDELRFGGIDYWTILRLCQSAPFRIEYKGGMVECLAETVIVTTSRQNFNQIWPAEDNYDEIERRITMKLEFIGEGKINLIKG